MKQFANILLARQPIYKADGDLFGFELLYRSDSLKEQLANSGYRLTSELLINLCTNAFDEEISVNKPILVKVDSEFLLSESFIPSTSNNVILEILESVEMTTELLDSVKKLKRKGYVFALDNYTFDEKQAELLNLVSIIKIDVSTICLETLCKNIYRLNDMGTTLLAKSIESRPMYKNCLELNFDLYQGFYLDKPEALSGKRVESNKLVVLNLISELCRSDITTDEVSGLISCDPKLVFKMLKFINSPIFPFKREVKNIKEAVIILGLETIKRWAMVLSMMSESSQPEEYYRTLLARAKTCELFAQKYRKSNPDDYFTLGLFSGLDAVLNLEMKDLLDEVNMAEELRKELLIDTTDGGGTLQVIKALERQDHKMLNLLNNELFKQIGESYWDGLKWADEQMEMLGC